MILPGMALFELELVTGPFLGNIARPVPDLRLLYRAPFQTQGTMVMLQSYCRY
jgi:hypothetical protein